MSRILFVHNAPTRFVVIDRELLARRWRVREWYQRGKWIRLVSLARAVRRSGLVFCWFAGWHSFFPVLLARMMGRPSIVVVGGYDVANLPEAGYGSQRGGWRRRVARAVMRMAHCLVAFSRSARQEAIVNAGIEPGKITVVYQGVPPVPAGTFSARENLVITVGGVWRENLLRKGLRPFVRAAAHLPEARFVLVGKWYDDSIEELRRLAPANVEFAGFVPDERLFGLYRRASVYVQASLHEGFGMSVAEAMMAGCVPVVTRAGALPEVVGDAGIYADSNAPGDIASAVRRALAADGNLRRRARDRVMKKFPLERRREELHALVGRWLP